MIRWNELTWYSRLAAIVLFLGVLPTLSFYIGTQYELAWQEIVVVSHEANISGPINSDYANQPGVPQSSTPTTRDQSLVDSVQSVPFTGSPEYGEAPLVVTFSGTITAPAFALDFGDGTPIVRVDCSHGCSSLDGSNPDQLDRTHTYTYPGVYSAAAYTVPHCPGVAICDATRLPAPKEEIRLGTATITVTSAQ